MNPDLDDRLRQLPPDLAHPPDRFELVRRRVRRHRRQRRRRLAAAGVVAVVALGVGVPMLAGMSTGGARRAPDVVASDLADPTAPPGEPGEPGDPGGPGRDERIPLAAPVTTEGIGTRTVPLGPRPEGADAVTTDLRCLSAGTITWPDGASLSCSDADAGGPNGISSGWVLDLTDGQTQITMTAGAGVRWRIVTTYVRTDFVAAPTNANGDTYGTDNEYGTPDLIRVVADEGRTGYVYATDLADAGGPPPTTPQEAQAQQEADAGTTFTIPVYESDGETRIGSFTVG